MDKDRDLGHTVQEAEEEVFQDQEEGVRVGRERRVEVVVDRARDRNRGKRLQRLVCLVRSHI